MVVPPGHALASRKTLRFEQTLDHEHVSLPVNSAVQVMLQRAAGRLGRSIIHRVVVSNFEAALRVVRAGLAISMVPREVAAAQLLVEHLGHFLVVNRIDAGPVRLAV
jgi:DNA-binding transcriptional LysR family regulator